MLVVVLAGVAALVAAVWEAFRRRLPSRAIGAGTFFEGEGTSAADHLASICTDSTNGGYSGGDD